MTAAIASGDCAAYLPGYMLAVPRPGPPGRPCLHRYRPAETTGPEFYVEVKTARTPPAGGRAAAAPSAGLVAGRGRKEPSRGRMILRGIDADVGAADAAGPRRQHEAGRVGD